MTAATPSDAVNRDVVAIGTSAGGFQALLLLAKGLPDDFPASILVTMHMPSDFSSSFDRILAGAGPLRASFASDGQTLEKGRIYIAPPGNHLIVEGKQLWLGEGPRENMSRPAIDPMMRSVAVCCGNRAIGVILTGTLMDGASGLWAIGCNGGMTVVQDPADAEFPEMPRTALRRIKPDHVVPLSAIPGLLVSLVRKPASSPVAASDRLRYEVEIARSGRAGIDGTDWFGKRSVLTCPECGGVMWQFKDGSLSRYRCHIGHAFGGEEQIANVLDENIERAMVSALRSFNERISLVANLRDEANEAGQPELAKSWSDRVQELEREADVIKGAIRLLDQRRQKDAQT